MTSKMTMIVQDIMDLGFSKWTAYNILRQAKHIMVERGFDFYDNKGLGTVPTTVVTEFLGLEDITHG